MLEDLNIIATMKSKRISWAGHVWGGREHTISRAFYQSTQYFYTVPGSYVYQQPTNSFSRKKVVTNIY
jgi:hypothetical protein